MSNKFKENVGEKSRWEIHYNDIVKILKDYNFEIGLEGYSLLYLNRSWHIVQMQKDTISSHGQGIQTASKTQS